jgi:hypothetical protein
MQGDVTETVVRNKIAVLIHQQLRRIWPAANMLDIAAASTNAADSLLEIFVVIPKREI